MLLTLTSLCSSHKTTQNAAYRTSLKRLDDKSFALNSCFISSGSNWDHLAMIALRNANRNDIPTPKMVGDSYYIILPCGYREYISQTRFELSIKSQISDCIR